MTAWSGQAVVVLPIAIHSATIPFGRLEASAGWGPIWNDMISQRSGGTAAALAAKAVTATAAAATAAMRARVILGRIVVVLRRSVELV